MLGKNGQAARTIDSDDYICKKTATVLTETDETLVDSKRPRPVLVVDDSRTVLLFVQRVLGEAKIRTAIASTLAATIEVISTQQPELILLDLSIAEHDGEALLRWFIKEGIFQRTRVILFSNRVEAVLRATAIRLGAAGYLRKTGIANEVVSIVSAELALLAGRK